MSNTTHWYTFPKPKFMKGGEGAFLWTEFAFASLMCIGLVLYIVIPMRFRPTRRKLQPLYFMIMHCVIILLTNMFVLANQFLYYVTQTRVVSLVLVGGQFFLWMNLHIACAIYLDLTTPSYNTYLFFVAVSRLLIVLGAFCSDDTRFLALAFAIIFFTVGQLAMYRFYGEGDPSVEQKTQNDQRSWVRKRLLYILDHKRLLLVELFMVVLFTMYVAILIPSHSYLNAMKSVRAESAMWLLVDSLIFVFHGLMALTIHKLSIYTRRALANNATNIRPETVERINERL